MLTLLCDLNSGDRDAPVLRYAKRVHEDPVAHLGEGQKIFTRKKGGQRLGWPLCFCYFFKLFLQLQIFHEFRFSEEGWFSACYSLLWWQCVEGQGSHLGTDRKQGDSREQPRTIRSPPPPPETYFLRVHPPSIVPKQRHQLVANFPRVSHLGTTS